MLIDTHAHIDMDDYTADFEEMLERSVAESVEKIIIPGVEPSTFDRILNIVHKYPNVYGAVGVHPSEAKSFDDVAANRMAETLKDDKILAVGEIGLDYYWDTSFNDLQKEVFARQIEIAKNAKKPIIVHDREAHSDSFNILKENKANEVGVVMHCFSGSAEFAMQCVREGFYIALGGVVTFKNAKKMKEVAQVIPLEKLLLETDSPYLTPEPYRGKRNEPSYVKFVAREIAELRGVSYEEIEKVTTENAQKLFGF